MNNNSVRCPQPFLEVLVHDTDNAPSLLGVCAGYEREAWRSEQLAKHLCEWLPEFALDASELEGLDSGKLVPIIRKAAQAIYTTKKFKKRGELGELLLHAIARQVYNTTPAISKIYYKDSRNDTVKGFDAVHLIENGTELELWLGEAKFYESLTPAITAVIKDLKDHSGTDYLRAEFTAITNKLNPSLPSYEKLKKLLDENTSLDTVFDRLIIPVLLTYNSDVISKHKVSDDKYREEIKEELKEAHQEFCKGFGSLPLRVHLFLVPLHTKKKLNEAFDAQLKNWQKI